VKKSFVAIIGLLSGFRTEGQPNIWISPASGKWEAPINWSLGVPPSQTQFIFITNAGADLFFTNGVVGKEVRLDALTSGGFPSTMTVANLTLSGAGTNIVNWLDLTNAGIDLPLDVLNQISMAEGSLLSLTNSSLQVGGSVFVGAPPLSSFIANFPATFIVDSGAAQIGTDFLLGAAFGSTGTLIVENGGDLNVSSGVLGIGNGGSATNGFGTGMATVDNAGLTAYSIILGSIGGGLGTLQITNNSTVFVGSNITLLSGSSGTSSVAISGGSLIVPNGPIQVGPEGNGLFTISGGNHIIRQLLLGGSNGFGSGSFVLSGGTLKILGIGAGPGDGLDANFALQPGGDMDGSGTSITVGDYHSATYIMVNGFAQFAAAYVGNNTNGTFTISNGTFVISSNVLVGQNCGGPNSALGTVTLYEGQFFVTNDAHTAVLEVSNGSFTVNPGATLVVDNLVTNSPCGQFTNNGGWVFYTGSLLLNPGAETGDLANWTPGGNPPGVDNGTLDTNVPPHTGSYDFIGGDLYSGGPGSLSQTVQLADTNGITALELDSGLLTANVSFWEQTADSGQMVPPYDGAQVSIAFLDSGANVIGSDTSTELESVDSWTNCTAQFPIPFGTRSVQYTLEFISSGNPGYVYVDDNFFGVYPTQTIHTPFLNSFLTGTNLVLSWPTWATNYATQFTTNLSAADSWQTLTNARATIQGAFVLTNSIHGPACFYRLRSQ